MEFITETVSYWKNRAESPSDLQYRALSVFLLYSFLLYSFIAPVALTEQKLDKCV